MFRDETFSQRLGQICFVAGVLLLGAAWQTAAWRAEAKSEQADLEPSDIQTEPTDRSHHSTHPFSSLDSTIAVIEDILSDPNQPFNANRLLVDLSDRRVYVYQNDRLQVSYPVAVGKSGWQTPVGVFRVQHMERNPGWRHPITGEKIAAGPDNPLGSRWIGFWSDGRSKIGFHGTNQGDSIGEAVSHGCLRLHNPDIIVLYQQVQPGMLVRVQL